MTTWVLPGILKAEDVSKVSPELLKMMSNISTGVILGYVNKFIEAYGNSSDAVLSQAAQILADAYNEVNRVNEYLNSDEAKNLSDTLCSLQYSDVSAEMPVEQLISYRAKILELLAEDPDFVADYGKDCSGSNVTGYKSAYTAKLDENNFDRVYEEMTKFITSNPESTKANLNLTGKIYSNRNLFINSRTKVNSPTVLRKAIYHKDRLRSILRGLDFLIEKKNSGESPRAWRRI